MPAVDVPAAAAADAVARTRAMASEVTVRWRGKDDAAGAAVARALELFHTVDRTCTRFDSGSDLMRANAVGDEWTTVSRPCFDALVEAFAAYRRTNGRFDPRVLNDLVRHGYDISMTRRAPQPRSPAAGRGRPPLPAWEPRFRRESLEVCLGPVAVDLGGIGKGLAVRWAGQLLAPVCADVLLTAGGDCLARGRAGDGAPWRVGVEDPSGGADPVAVLELRDEAVATSSVRVCSWQVGSERVHHLIDPATGRPGGAGLAAVSVVDPDPAAAEVWSKVLFLAGRRGVRTSAEHHGVPALWVGDDGAVGWTPLLADRLCWTAA